MVVTFRLSVVCAKAEVEEEKKKENVIMKMLEINLVIV